MQTKYWFHMKFEVLTAIGMTMAAFWDGAPCSRDITLVMQLVALTRRSLFTRLTLRNMSSVAKQRT